MQIDLITPGEKEYRDFNERLVAFNKTKTEWDADVFVLAARSQNGATIGGLRAVVRMRAAEVSALWLDDTHRGKGLGTCIMRRLETEVALRGAERILLDTYSFQARDFYERLGYECFGTFEYPNGVQRFYMQKNL